MLSDWERRQLEGIERDLRADASLTKLLSDPSLARRSYLVFLHWFYPHGYLVCALVYMLLSLPREFLQLPGALLVIGGLTWLILTPRVLPPR